MCSCERTSPCRETCNERLVAELRFVIFLTKPTLAVQFEKKTYDLIFTKRKQCTCYSPTLEGNHLSLHSGQNAHTI